MDPENAQISFNELSIDQLEEIANYFIGLINDLLNVKSFEE